MNQQNQPPYAQTMYYAPPKKRPVWPWIAGLAVVLAGVIVWAAVAGPNREEGGVSYAGYSSPYIAVLYVEDTMTTATGSASLYASASLYDHTYLLSTIDQLIADKMNKGLLLYIDSPGGEIMAAAELGKKLSEYKSTTGRPVYAYGHNYAASGGYWVAAAADRFYADRYCITGSIGVTYGTMFDFSGLLEKYGIKTTTITSGEQKDMGNYLESMSTETRGIFQAIIDEYYGYFIDWVAEERGMDRGTLLTLADGRIYTAAQAVDNGLADEVGAYSDCLADLQEMCGEDCPALDFYSTPATNWLDMLYYLKADGSEIAALLQVLPPSGVLAYYQE